MSNDLHRGNQAASSATRAASNTPNIEPSHALLELIKQIFLGGSGAGMPILSGGLPDSGGLTPVAEIAGSMNNCGGTVVMISDIWALTASHCVSAAIPSLVLRCAWAGSQLVEVASIYWQNGDEVSPGLGDLWPADAASMIEAMDEIVLLRLKAPSGWVAPPKLGWAKLIVDPQLAQHDILFVSGFGEDDAGNLPVEFPCCAATRFFGSRSNWRGAVYRDPNLSYAGMPRPGDSGAPVFQLDPLNPAENVRLCGIHSGPADSGETVITQPPHEVGEFLPLHPAVLSWIHKKTGLPLLARTATSSRALLSHAQRTTRTDTFVLRDRFTCFYLTSVNDLDVSTVVGSETEWHLSDVFSPHRYMTACEDVTISGGKLKLNYVGAQPIDLTKETQEGAPFHWLFGSDGKADFYVFRLLDGVAPDGTVRRRIRIEVFVNGSASPRPRPGSGGNIADNTEIAGQGTAIADPCPKPVQHKKPQALRDSHQDDQGNGYERKRN